MNGEINNDAKDEKLTEHIDRLEKALGVAGLIVVIGLLAEDGPELWKSVVMRTLPSLALIGGALVTLGVAAEVIFAVVIARIAQRIDADAALNIAKANELAADANARAAGLEVEALQLRKQLQLQGPRANLITGQARKQLVDALKQFTKQPVDVRHCATVIGANRRILTVTPIGDDVVGLASALIDILKEADWDVPSKPMPSTLQGEGIAVQVAIEASDTTKAAAQAFVEALRYIPLAVEDPSHEHGEPWRRRPSDDPIEPPFGQDTIVIDVLPHP